ncbi:amylo-alpha-1,6-glucosidase [uncultured Tyzzerella sp.]|uniref:amylo-alpha-1,6-glucosidase n=1 Tax=uncultured Tyzzerella sp. TaxID=2321398 RepID=UPI002942D9D3|nr:amylo-alpha-1,6-glucosidase [uncultured Tyzzerella sp.]
MIKFSYGSNNFKNKKIAQENCYLLTNGLGGYSTLSIINSIIRNDNGVFVVATIAPNIRYTLIGKLEEIVTINGKQYELTSQEYVQHTKNKDGEKYLVNFSQKYLPVWHYIVDGVEIIKSVVLAYGENTLGVKYEIINHLNKKVSLEVTPALQFCNKGEIMDYNQPFNIYNNKISANNIDMNVICNSWDINIFNSIQYENDIYYSYDAKDGRESVGRFAKGISYIYDFDNNNIAYLQFTLTNEQKDTQSIFDNEIKRQKDLIEKCGLEDDIAKVLVRATDQFICRRESTDSLTIMAGYPFFADWGRDTMYALEGCCITTKRYEDAKDIFRTFIKYLKNGIMPNLFPEGGNDPLYNTVDASLLFIQGVYTYYKATKDIKFIEEAFEPMVSVLENYMNGTDYDIKMDTDYLIKAGSGYNQLTWMDVRFDTELPTPRHGKPVEINAFWYSSLKIVNEFGKLLNKDTKKYEELSEKVKKSFNEKFWNEKENCLKDVVSGEDYDYQVRCNQIWAVSCEFSPIDTEKAKMVVDKVFDKLYTPYGLRSLSPDDVQFVPEYSGKHYKRDMSYHQGTVWTFPLGSYFRAYLKVNNYSNTAKEVVKKQLSFFEDALREGCVGQVAEIYDGLLPNESRGCFAQAWSVSEILKIYDEL